MAIVVSGTAKGSHAFGMLPRGHVPEIHRNNAKDAKEED
jgi:hypothetical protein